MMNSLLKNRKNYLYIVLCCIFLTNALIAEIIGVKIMSLEALWGSTPLNFQLTETLVINFNLTAGVIIWPVVFITTDIINEYYGKEGVKRITYLACIFIAYVFLVIWIATLVPPAEFWKDNNHSFLSVFSVGMKIILGSLTAFLISQLLDAYVFHYLRKITGSKKIWLRATGSTLVSQLVDSFLVIYIAFYLLESEKPWTASQLLSVGISNYVYKFVIAVILTPLLYLAHSIIDNYLGKDAQEMMKAAENE